MTVGAVAAATLQPDRWVRLAAYIEAARKKPFRWGENDCALFAAGAVEVLIGEDPAGWFRGRYGDEDGARAALERFGCATLGDAVARIADERGWSEIETARARRGDLVLGRGLGEGLDGLGVCVGANALFMTPRGLLPVARQHWVKAWRV